MKKYSTILFAIALCSFVACHKPSYQQMAPPWEPDFAIDRFEKEIKDFEAEDAQKMPAAGGIVMTGSSSFRLWKTAEEDLAPLPIINRGFGGSTLSEVLHYTDRTVLKYKPATIVVYCENDQFGKKPKTPEQTRDTYVTFTQKVRAQLPDVQMYFVSLKPSPSRWDRREEVKRTNQLIREFVKSDRHHEYVDVWPTMLKDGRPDGSIYVKDSLHMNAEGYRRWTEVIKPVLSKK
ncbi:GDSL-type esterase/lipase family protein [Arundinibacter roseus]|uniref:SGNH hydrolase-type esterase domain-containing protein n=1 Tax=Arundinibacter roseus TaxID=2070510 RepID=A0A4R4K8Z7_9BACT|nr:GDSL-type esterase/lipase family protein [Arundinibacter roseus]TDB64158.1 hypothetical protein EZE20_14560 [Arundinibacter roseus]